MTWVPIPNKQDGNGYLQLVEDHTNGAGHYAAWMAIVLVASKCDPRGTLLQDGLHPHTPQSVARKSRIPASLIEEAIPRLLDIGWLEVIEIPQHDAELLRTCDTEGKGREGEGEQNTEGEGKPPPPVDSALKKSRSRMTVAEKRSALWDECLRQAEGRIDKAEELLKRYSAFKNHNGIRNVRSLTAGWLDVTFDKAFSKAEEEERLGKIIDEVSRA